MKNTTLTAAIKQLKAGKVVAFPTETVYGLGANAFNAAAVKKIYALKGRPSKNPLIVHIASTKQLAQVSPKLHPLEKKLIAAFWPGPLTLVLPKTKKVPAETTGGLSTVAVRMPEHPLALELIEKAGFPIAAPSANPSGKPSATHHKHVQKYFGAKLLTLEGGPTQHGLESTVVHIKKGVPHMYRLGSITPKDIQKATGKKPVLETKSKHSPGTRFKHYAPDAHVIILTERQWKTRIAATLKKGKKVGALTTTQNAGALKKLPIKTFLLGSNRDLLTMGSRLYSGLLELDALHLDTIFVQSIPKKGLGAAIMDRLHRAASR